MDNFKVGEYIIYVNGDRYELGRIKRLTEDGAFICYHEGETAAKTPYDLIHKLVNGFTIKETTIGGEVFRPHGEWHDKKMKIKGGHGYAYGKWGCSVCKKKFESKSNFCPNCGTKMVEP